MKIVIEADAKTALVKLQTANKILTERWIKTPSGSSRVGNIESSVRNLADIADYDNDCDLGIYEIMGCFDVYDLMCAISEYEDVIEEVVEQEEST